MGGVPGDLAGNSCLADTSFHIDKGNASGHIDPPGSAAQRTLTIILFVPRTNAPDPSAVLAARKQREPASSGLPIRARGFRDKYRKPDSGVFAGEDFN